VNLRQIEVFRAVMLAGSVTDAAKMLHVSQPGISRMLGHIELQLGLKLFNRVKGKLVPTPEAQILHAQVENVYQGVRRIDEVGRELKQGGGLALRVLASPSMALEVVPQALSELCSRFPGARIYMETQLVRDIVAQLSRGEADIAISSLPVEHGLVHSEPVGEWALSCVFAAGHAFASKRSIGLRDVMQERLIAFSPDTPQGRVIEDWCRRHDQQPDARIEVRSGQVACALAAAGAGVAIVDNLTARAWRSGKLGFRPLSRGPSYTAYAVRHANVPPSALTQALVQRVKAGFQRIRKTPAFDENA
jgi:DNA-binding transcriptional LysR family regulator